MRTPPYLQAGDKVAIVAPARKVSGPEMEPAINTLQSWGLEVLAGAHLFGECHQYSGTDSERLSDLQQMLDDKSIKAIFCARGGYGTLRIIDQIDFTHFAQHPKWVIGYSDITVLHAHIVNCLGIETMHATMPIHFGEAGATQAIEALCRALFGEPLLYNLSPHPLNLPGSAVGPVVGGNLSILYALSGSGSNPPPLGSLLFLEDLDEYLYHIDRMMVNLARSNQLSQSSGLIVGALTRMNDNAVPFGLSAEEIIHEKVAQTGLPLCFGFPAGHVPANMPLIMGRQTRLLVDAQGATIKFDQAPEYNMASND